MSIYVFYCSSLSVSLEDPFIKDVSRYFRLPCIGRDIYLYLYFSIEGAGREVNYRPFSFFIKSIFFSSLSLNSNQLFTSNMEQPGTLHIVNNSRYEKYEKNKKIPPKNIFKKIIIIIPGTDGPVRVSFGSQLSPFRSFR